MSEQKHFSILERFEFFLNKEYKTHVLSMPKEVRSHILNGFCAGIAELTLHIAKNNHEIEPNDTKKITHQIIDIWKSNLNEKNNS